MKKTLAIVLALLMVLAVFAGCGSKETGDQSLAKVKEAKKLVLGFDPGFVPMGYKDTNGEYIGFDVDLAKEVAKRMDVELVLQPIAWEAKEAELNTGNIDCIWNGLTITPQREAEMNIARAYMENKQIIVVRKDSGITKLSDLAGKTVVAQTDSSAQSLIESDEHKALLDSFKDFVTLADYVIAFTELNNKQVDAVAIDSVMAEYYISHNNLEMVILDEDLGDEKYGVAFRKNDLALVAEFNKIFDEMIKDGTAAEISDKWFGKDVILK